LAFLAILLAMGTGSAAAQTTISYYSKLAHHGAIPAQCLMAGDALVTELNQFPHPATWTYIVVCDDRSWDDVMTANGQTQAKYIHGATDRVHHLTMFRGTTLRDDNGTGITSDHVVAHELCHIFLHSDDEVAVDTLALAWVKNQNRQLIATLNGTGNIKGDK